MSNRGYLEGFIPYKEEVIEEYVGNGAWANLTYGDLLDRAVAQHPDSIAVIDDWNRLTYKELNEKVKRFAIALVELGAKPHDRMVIQLPNRYEFVVAFYGMQKIGAVPVLAVPRHGYQEISAFFRLTEAAGWIVPVRDGKLEFISMVHKIGSEFEGLRYIIMPEDAEALPQPALSMEKLISDVKIGDYAPDYLDQFRPDPNDVAVLLPTGGTTGLPKMVPRTHNSLIVTNDCISKRIAPSGGILLQATPVGHAMAMQGSVNCAMFAGATLVLQGVPRPTEILETIEKEKITGAAMVPTQLEGVVNHPDLGKYDVSSLKVIATAGAGLPMEVARRTIEYFGRFGCRFSGNGLGASEGLLALGDINDSLEVKLKTVGKNVTPGSHYKVIDEEERQLPSNTEGELVARGPEVFTGYYKATEEENKEVFTHDGYYRTGDLAKIDERGYITISGRKKDVIIRGGETLVPSEMEDLIRKHPDVDKVAVVGMPDPGMGERACAYVVLKPEKRFTLDGMISFLKGQGAGVLLFPERLEIIDRLPETGVGKVDKKSLRKNIEEKLGQEGILKK
jgi:non-ribosomal peptide synthetase component E (peptide arylation enzyme)